MSTKPGHQDRAPVPARTPPSRTLNAGTPQGPSPRRSKGGAAGSSRSPAGRRPPESRRLHAEPGVRQRLGPPPAAARSHARAPTHLQVHPDHPLGHAIRGRHGCATRADTPRPEPRAPAAHAAQQPGAQAAAAHLARAAEAQPARGAGAGAGAAKRHRAVGGAGTGTTGPAYSAPGGPGQQRQAAEGAAGTWSPAAAPPRPACHAAAETPGAHVCRS